MSLLFHTLDDPPSMAQQPGFPKVVVGPNDLWTALRWLWLHRPVGANKLEGQALVDWPLAEQAAPAMVIGVNCSVCVVSIGGGCMPLSRRCHE